MVETKIDYELLNDLKERIKECTDSEELEKLTAAYLNACKATAAVNDSVKQNNEEDVKFNRRVRIAELVFTGLSTAAVFYGIWTGRQSNLDGIYAEEKLQKFVNNKFYHPVKTKF